jgi:hypothetical protein
MSCDGVSRRHVLQGKFSAMQVINGLLTEDVFALVMEHCSVPQRAQLASVCKLWNGLVKRGWKSITLHDPNLAKQMTWLKKINQDTLKVLIWSQAFFN